MAQSQRNRKLGRWGRETALREAPLDEVAAPGAERITMPSEDMPISHRAVDADEASIAVDLRDLRTRLSRARWIPWRRNKRPQMRAQIDALAKQRERIRASCSRARRL
jgi:hypothetical protein